MQSISLRSLDMRRKQNIEIFFGFTSDITVLTFTFRFFSSPLSSLSLPHFFSLAGHLVGFILVGNVFRKAFRILGLDERKGRWVVEKDFRRNFQVNVKRFFAFWPVSLTELCSFWLSLTIKTDDITSGWKDVDPHGRLREAQGQMG